MLVVAMYIAVYIGNICDWIYQKGLIRMCNYKYLKIPI